MAPLIDETNYLLESQSTSFERAESPSSFDIDECPKKKSVSFSVMSDLYLIPHAKDLNRKDKEAYWMTKNDFRRIERENINTLHFMAEGHYPVNQKEYFRGLENLMPEARNKRKQRINFVISAIMREQKKNKRLNDKWMEEFHKCYTSKSAEAAYNKGVWDATEASRGDGVKSIPEVWI